MRRSRQAIRLAHWKQYDVVLAVEPEHAAALAGRARAERLPDVLQLVQRARLEVARGELDAALSTYREALEIDADWPAATAGVVEVNGLLREAEYERLVSAGLGLLAAEDFTAAQREFAAALALRPGSREAVDGLAQAEEGAKLDQIELAEVRALAFERRELWDQAIELYREVLATHGTLLFAQTGLERAEARAGLDSKLTNLIDNPTLLFGDAVLADARALLEAAGAETDTRAASHAADREARRAHRGRFTADLRAARIGPADECHVVSCRHAWRVRLQRSRAAPGQLHGDRQP